MHKLAILAVLISTSTLALEPAYVLAAPSPQPLPQVGSCPSGYSSGSGYCTPWSSGARFAFLKVRSNGSCPSGYGSEGAYCVAENANTKTAIPRSGSCPSGWGSDGDYCVAPR